MSRSITKKELKTYLADFGIAVKGNYVAKKDVLKLVANKEDPIWTENKELRDLIHSKVKGIKEIKDSSIGITSFLVFPSNTDFHVQVNIGYDNNRKLYYDVFKIVDGDIDKSKLKLKTRDDVVSAVNKFAMDRLKY